MAAPRETQTLASMSHLWPVNAPHTHHKWDTHRQKWDKGGGGTAAAPVPRSSD